MKKKTIKKIGNYSFWIVFVVVLFTSSLRAEVFGFIQRGVLELGIMNPDTTTETTEDNKAKKASYEVKLLDQNGNKVDMANLKDKVIFINFWATWCPPCIAEMPSIDNLHEHFEKDEDVVFLMISLDKNFEKAKKFKSRKEFDFDVHKTLGNLPRVYQSRSIPTTFVVDKDGNIAFEHKGMADYDTKKFKNFINNLK